MGVQAAKKLSTTELVSEVLSHCTYVDPARHSLRLVGCTPQVQRLQRQIALVQATETTRLELEIRRAGQIVQAEQHAAEATKAASELDDQLA